VPVAALPGGQHRGTQNGLYQELPVSFGRIGKLTLLKPWEFSSGPGGEQSVVGQAQKLIPGNSFTFPSSACHCPTHGTHSACDSSSHDDSLKLA